MQRSLQDVYFYEFSFSGEYNFKGREVNDVLANALNLSIAGKYKQR